jgi:hypothetical protein
MGLYALPAISQVVRNLDFVRQGNSAFEQCKLIYGSCIGSRATIGAIRSGEHDSFNPVEQLGNEGNEVVRRDGLGWLFWFYATPMVQAATLLGLSAVGAIKGDVRKILLTRNPEPESGFWKKLNYQINPLVRYNIPKAPEIGDRIAQLEKIGPDKLSPEKKKALMEALVSAKNYRNVASFAGLAFAIFLLGVAINKVNIWVTRHNVAARKKREMAETAEQVAPPSQPRTVASSAQPVGPARRLHGRSLRICQRFRSSGSARPPACWLEPRHRGQCHRAFQPDATLAANSGTALS